MGSPKIKTVKVMQLLCTVKTNNDHSGEDLIKPCAT